jgi:hypothetical protein
MNPTQKNPLAPPTEPNDGTMELQCVTCNHSSRVLMPIPEIANTAKSSVVVLTHEKPIACRCGTLYIFHAVSAMVDIRLAPIPPEAAPSLIVPAQGKFPLRGN